jgi:hypothetical protein
VRAVVVGDGVLLSVGLVDLEANLREVLEVERLVSGEQVVERADRAITDEALDLWPLRVEHVR